jgi:hypothetical protein
MKSKLQVSRRDRRISYRDRQATVGRGVPPARMIRARSGPAVVLVMLSTVTVSYTLVLSMVNPALEPLRVSFHTSQTGIS